MSHHHHNHGCNSNGASLLMLGAPLAAVGAVGFVGGSIAGGVVHWMKDVFRGIATIAKGSGSDPMKELAKRIAIADVVTLIALADGRVDQPEQAALKALAADDKELGGELQEALARWYARSAELQDPAKRSRLLTVAAAPLAPSDREELRGMLLGFLTEGPQRADVVAALA